MSEPAAERPNLRAKLHDVPHKPGVYLMRDRLNRVIYVGKARDLRKRLSNYFMPSRKMRADLKTRALLESIWDFEVHLVRSEPEALLLEGRLIKEFRPRYNVSFRDDKRFLLVRVDLREEWPRFRLARFRKDDGARYFGPFAYAGALRQTLNFLRRKYGVLTFGRGAPSERELKYSCYQVPARLADLTAEQYRERVAQACAVLDGETTELVDTLQQEMEEAARALDFERAAELRNMISDLKATTKPMRKFTRSSLPSLVDPARDLQALQDALGLEQLPRVMECFDISNISVTHVVASMVCFRDGTPDKSNYRRYRITSIQGQDDFAAMAEVVRRRYSRILLESRLPETGRPAVRLPDLVIVDGGKGQLSSASRELGALGLAHLPIIGLAKQHEEIFRPGRPAPLVLPEDSGALRLLQRIRDEAHRFANSYHQLLMKRRIAESILDDCPGVSEHRKQLLLRAFGSIQRMRKASAEEIAAVSGIGPKLASQVALFLEERAPSKSS
jgi:excinuclease ABC subunit C